MTSEFFFESANTHFKAELPFVLYKKPNSNIVKGLFQNNDTVFNTENFTESGFVFAPFNTEEQTILIPFNTSEAKEIEYKTEVSYNNQEKTLPENTVSKDKLFHVNLVLKAIEAIKNKDFIKVVISRKESIELKEKNPITLFKRLLQYYPNAFVYCWYHPKIGLWLGATPETLLETESNRFKTMALAGTQQHEDNTAVSWQFKEKEEQQLVTNFIINSLNASVKNLKIGETQTVKAGHLLHLRTKISGILNSSLETVIKALHPTPAICGLPKAKTKKFIIDQENYNREFYSGFLGELNLQQKQTRNTNRRNIENNAYRSHKKVSNLFVNLRCMQLKNNYAFVYVGGGITKDSIAESEWQETVNKTQTIKKVLF